jgi:hypothetical protein
MTRTLLLALLLLFDATATAAELTHLLDDGRIGVRIRSLSLPESLRKELRSGLTNRLLLRVTLLDGAQVQATANVAIALKYDLWDERFTVEQLVNDVAAQPAELKSVDDAMLWLGDLQLRRLFVRTPASRSLVLRVEALLNPIERERMERIREWVKENSSYVPLEGGARSTTAESSSNAVFNKIFEEYAAGRDYASTWRQELASSPFTVSP